MRVIVIGAGVLGAAIGRTLAREGHAVTILDPDPGGIASRGSFGWLNAASAEDEHYCRVRQRALALWHRLKRDEPACPVAFAGMLLWEAHRGALADMAGRLSALGHAAELVERERIARLEPSLAAPPDCALWLPGEGWAEPRQIAGWFLAAAVEAGAKVERRRATAIEATGSRWRVRHDDGQLAAERVVLAAGAATPELLAPVGLGLRLRTEPGLIVRTTAAAPALRCILGSPDVHLWQAADGTVIAGSDYGGTQRFDEPDMETRAILSRIGALMPAFAGVDAAKVTVTERPMLPDDRPAVGALAPGLDVAVTHSGMTLAPLIAETLAARIGGGDADPDLAPYRPDRPAVTGAPEAAR